MMDLSELRNEMESYYNTIVTLPYLQHEIPNEVHTPLESVEGRKLDVNPRMPKARTNWSTLCKVQHKPKGRITIKEGDDEVQAGSYDVPVHSSHN